MKYFYRKFVKFYRKRKTIIYIYQSRWFIDENN